MNEKGEKTIGCKYLHSLFEKGIPKDEANLQYNGIIEVSNLIDIFEQENGVPLLYKNGVGQYDLKKKLLREFSCKYDCIKELKMSDKTLNKSLQNYIPYNGHYYYSLGIKLSVK